MRALMVPASVRMAEDSAICRVDARYAHVTIARAARLPTQVFSDGAG